MPPRCDSNVVGRDLENAKRDLLLSYLVGVSPEGVKFVGVMIFGNAEEGSPPSCQEAPASEGQSYLDNIAHE